MRCPLLFAVASLSLLPLFSCQCDEPLHGAPATLRGVVCDADSGAPVEGVPVSFVRDDDGARQSTTTASDGSFELDDLTAGDGTLVLPTGEVALHVDAGDRNVFTDATCRELPTTGLGDVQGKVCNRHVGDVVRDATVFITDGTGARHEDQTDAEGRFFLADIPAGAQVLTVTATGFNKTELVTVIADDEIFVDVGGACSIPAPEGVGAIEGRVCAPDGTTWLADATVYVDPDGNADERVETTTDADGNFHLGSVPAGAQTVHIEKGAFSTTHDVVVVEGGVVTIPEEQCALDDEINIAVVRGSQYDNVEGVLAEIGVPAASIDVFTTDWAEQLLSTDDGLDGYDILFLNCRSNEVTYGATPAMQDRLRRWVEAGGKLHASDQAYDLIEITWPDKIDFFGDDSVRGAGDQGAIVDLQAQVIDASLAAGLGSPNLTIHYGLETWSNMVSAAPDVDTYVRGDSPLIGGAVLDDAPQIVGFFAGSGHVVYSSFHQEPGIGAQQERIMQLLMFEL